MTLSSISSAQNKLWENISEAQRLQHQANMAPPEERVNFLAQLAHCCSQKIFQSNRPRHEDSEITKLDIEHQALFSLNQACKTNNINQIRNKFHNLPEDVKNFLLWAIWIVDSLEREPIQGLSHSIDRFNKSPMIIGSDAKKAIYLNGNSLVEQLLNYKKDTLSLKYQEKIAANLPKEHLEQQKLAKMQLARDLAQYNQMIALKPWIATDEQRSSFEKYLSPRVHSWLNTKSELYESRGAHYYNNKTTFSVYAPNAQNVQCLLTAFGQIARIVDMRRQADGTWMASVDQVSPGATYLYRVKDCQGKITDRVDPFSFGNIHIPETDTIHSVVVDRNRFAWNDSAWLANRTSTEPLKQPLSIYEVHIKSWTEGKKNLREIAHQLAAHCKEMGFTHVELYGIMEHFWGKARGYQVTNFFAPYHDVGSYEDMKYFVNYMHQQGLGVIADWIPAHYDHGEAHNRHLSASMYQFDGTDLFGNEKSPWDTKYVDYSKPEARNLIEASAFWWLKEFHLDGLRVDAVSQLVKRNDRDVQSGIEFLGQLNNKIHALCPGVLMIAEATDWDPRVCRPTKENGFGFDLNWSVGASHNLHNYLKTPEHERSNLEHHKKLENVFQEGQRTHEKKISTHSHDDMDGGYNNHDKTLYNLGKNHSNETERLKDLRNFFALQIFGPNWGHLIHMGDEFAQPESWYARFQNNQSSMNWESANHHPHNFHKEFVKDAIHHYKSAEDFWKEGGENSELICSHDSNKVLAYSRAKNIIIHNFSNTGYNSYEIPISSRFKGIAQMQERINSDATRYGGSGQYLNGNVSILHDSNGSKLNVKMPPRSTLVFSHAHQKTVHSETIPPLRSGNLSKYQSMSIDEQEAVRWALWVLEGRQDELGFSERIINTQPSSLSFTKAIQLVEAHGKNIPAVQVGNEMIVKCKVAPGHGLSIRGDTNGLNWNNGAPLTQVGEDTWVYRSPVNLQDMEYKILLDDSIWQEGANNRVSAGKIQGTSPRFTPPVSMSSSNSSNVSSSHTNSFQIRRPSPPSPTQNNTHVHSPRTTRITVKFDAGWGNKLFIRGSDKKGPKGMNWDQGIELRNEGKDTWVFETQLPFDENFEYKILLNDQKYEEGDNHAINCGSKKEITPKF